VQVLLIVLILYIYSTCWLQASASAFLQRHQSFTISGLTQIMQSYMSHVLRSLPQAVENNTPRSKDAAGESFLYDKNMIRVYLANPLTEERSALRLMLLDLNMEVVGEAADWATTLAQAPISRTDILLIDWDLLPRTASHTALDDSAGTRRRWSLSLSVIWMPVSKPLFRWRRYVISKDKITRAPPAFILDDAA
jgi:hypothetical protein